MMPSAASMHLSVSPWPVRFVRFAKSHIRELVPALLKLLFYREAYVSPVFFCFPLSSRCSFSPFFLVAFVVLLAHRSDTFFSYTESPHEVSMVMSSSLASELGPW